MNSDWKNNFGDALPRLALCLLVTCFVISQAFAKEQIVDFPHNEDKQRERNVPIKFHFPKESSARPMVILSHGAGGSRDGFFSLASGMAKKGYVVMCIEHVTSNTDNIRARMKKKRLGFKNALIDSGKDPVARKNRPLDVSFAINFAERLNRKDKRFKGRIDFSKIGMLGHSYGAYTTMVCCGAKPVGIKEDLSESRIKVGIALSPQAANGHFFDKNSFQHVKVPFVGISGNKDTTQFLTSLKQREDIYHQSKHEDKHFIWYTDAGHFSFSDSSGSARKSLFRPHTDVTNSLKLIVPAIMDFYLLEKGSLDKDARDMLVKASISGRVQKIHWMSK